MQLAETGLQPDLYFKFEPVAAGRLRLCRLNLGTCVRRDNAQLLTATASKVCIPVPHMLITELSIVLL